MARKRRRPRRPTRPALRKRRLEGAMRRHLKRQLRDKDTSPIERENIEAILEDQQKLDELCDRFQTSRSQGEQEMMIAATDPTEPGGFFRERPLLNWLWENRMQIMQFIFAIMSAF